MKKRELDDRKSQEHITKKRKLNDSQAPNTPQIEDIEDDYIKKEAEEKLELLSLDLIGFIQSIVEGKYDNIKHIIKKSNADLNKQFEGKYPLDYAIDAKFSNTANLLISYGATASGAYGELLDCVRNDNTLKLTSLIQENILRDKINFEFFYQIICNYEVDYNGENYEPLNISYGIQRLLDIENLAHKMHCELNWENQDKQLVRTLDPSELEILANCLFTKFLHQGFKESWGYDTAADLINTYCMGENLQSKLLSDDQYKHFTDHVIKGKLQKSHTIADSLKEKLILKFPFLREITDETTDDIINNICLILYPSTLSKELPLASYLTKKELQKLMPDIQVLSKDFLLFLKQSLPEIIFYSNMYEPFQKSEVTNNLQQNFNSETPLKKLSNFINEKLEMNEELNTEKYPCYNLDIQNIEDEVIGMLKLDN